MSVPLRVGVVVPGWSGPGEPAALPALQEHLWIAGRSHAVRVVSLRHPGRTEPYVDQGGVAVMPLGFGTRGGPIGRAALIAAGVRTLRRLHGEAPFDVLHAFWTDEPGAVGVTAGRLLGVPVVVSVMGGELAAHTGIGYGARLGRGGRLTTDAALRGADLVTVGSSWLYREVAQRASSVPIRRMPLGVDLERFRPATTLPDGANLLFVGSLSAVKDPALLLRAFARVRTADATLTVAGDGPLRPGLERLAVTLGIASRVRFLGSVPRAQLPVVMRAARALVVTSHHEAQSMVAVEAAACGLSVVGTAVGVIPELAQAGGAIAIDGREPGVLAAAIDQAVDRARAEGGGQLGDAARQHAVLTWDVAATTRAMTSVWQVVVGDLDAA